MERGHSPLFSVSLLEDGKGGWLLGLAAVVGAEKTTTTTVFLLRRGSSFLLFPDVEEVYDGTCQAMTRMSER